MARDIELAVGAADIAVRDAGMVTRGIDDGEQTYHSDRIGCNIGAGLIATETDELTMALATSTDDDGRFSLRRWGERGMNNLQPLWMLKYLPNMLACHVTIIHGAEGPSNTVTCAEASGLLSLGESARVIERGSADVCLAGGAESKVNPMGLVRIGLAGRLASTGDETDGSAVLRPFDAESPGSLLGEGGGILVLEEAQAAADRGARVYAEITGFGAAQSTPPYEGFDVGDGSAGPAYEDGMVAAIAAAPERCGIDATQIDAIVPHGSGSARLDALEAGALRESFGDRLGSIPLVTWTPNVGDCFAGNGGLQVGLAARCVHEQKLPARVHAGRAVDGLDAGPAEARDAALRRP
jgi:3-oxoacyl-[acyl-carrier-protein] synthase II